MESNQLKVVNPEADNLVDVFGVEESFLDGVSKKIESFFENEMDILHGKKPDDDGTIREGTTKISNSYSRWHKMFNTNEEEQFAFIKVLSWAMEHYHEKTCGLHEVSDALKELLSKIKTAKA